MIGRGTLPLNFAIGGMIKKVAMRYKPINTIILLSFDIEGNLNFTAADTMIQISPPI